LLIQFFHTQKNQPGLYKLNITLHSYPVSFENRLVVKIQFIQNALIKKGFHFESPFFVVI